MRTLRDFAPEPPSGPPAGPAPMLRPGPAAAVVPMLALTTGPVGSARPTPALEMKGGILSRPNPAPARNLPARGSWLCRETLPRHRRAEFRRAGLMGVAQFKPPFNPLYAPPQTVNVAPA